ncbi:MAG: HipA domain-containing protein [Deltaproteobacteria bacterium]|nr:HipA domain-containing protein [Deltaproteobacteria bacterium]
MKRLRRPDLGRKLIDILLLEGVVSPARLLSELDISAATLSRLIAKSERKILRFGETTNTRYGMPREIPGIKSQIPYFTVNENGELKSVAKFIVFYRNTYAMDPGARFFGGLPPEIFDMAPQGFLGRGFVKRFGSELSLPARLSDWSNDHILAAVARRGEDFPGNVVFGQESAERWMRLQYEDVTTAQYPHLARAALGDQPVGSSAGGEQPKFTALTDGKHCIVKFAGMNDSDVQRLWRDLLICEWIALETLKSCGVQVANAKLRSDGQMVFLEVERFDRIGPKGRKAVLTLAAIDNAHWGMRDGWSEAAARLEQSLLVDKRDARTMRFLDAFGALIGDSDRHFQNIAFYPRHSYDAKTLRERYVLAPAFDKLPMMFAPESGNIIAREFPPPVPNAHMLDVWDEARKAAVLFWNRVCSDKRISKDFLKIAEQCRKTIVG